MAMETKVQRFVEQFGVNLYGKWQKSQETQVFWHQDATLRDFLEEAAAKLPQNALRGALTRDLLIHVRHLQQFLQAHHQTQQQEKSESDSTGNDYSVKNMPLLNEVQVEEALAQAHGNDQAQRRVFQALGHDDFGVVIAEQNQPVQEEQVVKSITKLVDALNWLWMRDSERQVALKCRKTAYIVAQLTHQMSLLLKTTGQQKSKKQEDNVGLLKLEPQQISALCVRLLQVLKLLNQWVQSQEQEAKQESASDQDKPSGLFYELPESSLLAEIDFELELARFCGSLIVFMTFSASLDKTLQQAESDLESDSESSDDSDSDSDSDADNAKPNKHKKQLKRQSFASMAVQAVSQVFVLAHHFTSAESGLPWLLQVVNVSLLSMIGSCPASSCCCQLYREVLKRGFSNYAPLNSSNTRRLLQFVVCIRLATEFLAEKRQQLCGLGTLDQVTQAYAACSAIEVPSSLLRWLKSKPEDTTEGRVWKKFHQLRKHNKSVLCRELIQKSTLNVEELQRLVQAFLKSEDEDAKAMWTRDNAGHGEHQGSADSQDTEEAVVDDTEQDEMENGSTPLFFIDPVGAESSRKRKSANAEAEDENAEDVDADADTEDEHQERGSEPEEQEDAEEPSTKRQRASA